MFFLLAYFTLYNRLQFHPPHQNWFKCTLFNGWIMLHCVYVPQLSYPFVCWWTSRFLSCPGYYKQCCDEHWVHVSLSILVSSVCVPSSGIVTGLILQSEGLSRFFSSTTVQKHQFFSAQPSRGPNCHINTWLTTALTIQTCISKVMSLLFIYLFFNFILFLNFTILY